jgi:hypothetical protein
MFCTRCGVPYEPTALFCSSCGLRLRSPDTTSDDLLIVESISTAPPQNCTSATTSIRTPTSRYPSTSSLTSEVRAQKAIPIKQDRTNSKDILPTSSFGLDPRGKALQQRTAEVFTVEKGMAPTKVPGALKRLKLFPHQIVNDWSAWVRERVHGFKQWDTRIDPDNFVEDESVPAFAGIVSPTGPIEIECESGFPLASLLAEVPEDGKTRIALIDPVRNLAKEEAETLTLPPANKRAKSPTGVAIPKRGGNKSKGGKGGRKAVVKKEEEDEDVEIKPEEGTDDEFPDLNDIVN